MSIQNERISLSILIDGVEMPLDEVTVVKVVICSRLHTYIPVGELVLSDPTGKIKKLITITDGIIVSLTVGTTTQNATSYVFRLFKPNIVSNANSTVIQFYLYWANARYWSDRTTQSQRSSSSALISYIALINQIHYVGDPTNDTQVWLPLNSRWCEFAHKAARTGWVDKNSAMMLGHRLDNTLWYKNVNAFTYDSQLPNFTSGLALPSPDKKILPCIGFKFVSVSGFDNHSFGYSGKQLNQDLSGVSSIESKIDKKRDSEFMYMNTDVKDTISSGPILVAPQDGGNTHANYSRAVYQNKRFFNTSSNRLIVASNTPTGLDLLDRVQTSLKEAASTNTSDQETNKDLSGYYFVGAKTIYVDSNLYYVERFTLIRSGHNSDPTNINKSV